MILEAEVRMDGSEDDSEGLVYRSSDGHLWVSSSGHRPFTHIEEALSNVTRAWKVWQHELPHRYECQPIIKGAGLTPSITGTVTLRALRTVRAQSVADGE